MGVKFLWSCVAVIDIRFSIFAAFLATAILAAPVYADGPAWSDLSATEKKQLSDFQSAWSGLSEDRKNQLKSNAEQISRMPEASRDRLIQNLNRRQTMSAEERKKVEQGQQQFNQLTTQQQDELRNKWQNLSDSEKLKLLNQ